MTIQSYACSLQEVSNKTGNISKSSTRRGLCRNGNNGQYIRCPRTFFEELSMQIYIILLLSVILSA
jgi:hypothetical protein